MNAIATPKLEPHPYFTKIGADGAALPREATQWEAVLDSRTGRMWAVQAIRVPNGHDATINAAISKCRAAGFSDWSASTVEQLFSLADRTRVEPAIDTEFFPDCPSDWFWTSSPDCESSDCAWIVYFYDGSSDRGGRNDSGRVRAVRVGS